MNPITLQISLSPSDFRHIQFLLPHQYAYFEPQVDEILLTYDTHRSKGRFAIDWEQNNAKMWDFLQNFIENKPKIKLIKIDYSNQKNSEIAQKYFKRNSIPAKDWRGGPFYTYFFGINEAYHNYIFHIDSDMFFGGLSQTWISEAMALYESDSTILFINPLAGPPKSDATLIGQNCSSYKSKRYFYEFNTMSTRLFLVSKSRLLKLPIEKIISTKWKELIRSLYKQNPPFRLPENILSQYLIQNKYIRVDFLGNNQGLWSLHPPYRTEEFYNDLPEIISKIEQGIVPDSQRGFYDIVDELVDWSEAKNKLINK